MKKIFLILLICNIGLMTKAQVQVVNNTNIYLSGYTLPAKGNVIGTVKLRVGEIKSIKLTGSYADAFVIGRNNELSVRRDRLPNAPVFEVGLRVTTGTGDQNITFRIVRDEFIHNGVIAHRGAWKNTGAAENSVAALNGAIRLGCAGSEFDVHMTADSVPVINHDAAIQGVSIARTTAVDLLKIKLINGEEVPTLETYLKAGIVQTKTKLILEIKVSELGKQSSLALTRKIISLVEHLRAQAWVDYISFDYDVCKEVMRLAPYARVAYLNGDKNPAELAADKFFGLDYHFKVLLEKNPTWVSEAKQHKLTTNVWTVNDQATMQTLLGQQVDFITTNEPELLLSIIKPK